jgi:hypothetical protein
MKETICTKCGAPLCRGMLVDGITMRQHWPSCPTPRDSQPMAALQALDPFQAVEDFRKAAAA